MRIFNGWVWQGLGTVPTTQTLEKQVTWPLTLTSISDKVQSFKRAAFWAEIGSSYINWLALPYILQLVSTDPWLATTFKKTHKKNWSGRFLHYSCNHMTDTVTGQGGGRNQDWLLRAKIYQRRHHIFFTFWGYSQLLPNIKT